MKKRILVAAALACVVAAAIGTYAWARTSAQGTIFACVAKADGSARIVAEGTVCKNGESPLEWNAQGPQGVQGAQGAAGRDGRDGQQGTQGPAGPAGGSSSDAADANMTVKGQVTGDFTASPMILIGLSHEVISPRDAASGLPTGKRQHKPIVITKSLDKASPLLFKALVTNENLTEVLIGLLQGGQTIATVKLTNASVASRAQHGTTETISFTYQKITWTWTDGGISAEDDWEAPVG